MLTAVEFRSTSLSGLVLPLMHPVVTKPVQTKEMHGTKSSTGPGWRRPNVIGGCMQAGTFFNFNRGVILDGYRM